MKTCKSNKPPLSDTKDLGGVVVSTRRQKNAPRPRRGTHSFARVRPSRPSADPLGSHAARHDRCVTREVGRTRASRVSRTPSPPATRARFVSAEALVRLLPRGAVRALGRPERSGNARATRIPLLGSVSALTGSTALPSLSHAPRARARDARVVTSRDGPPSRFLLAFDRARSRRLTSRRRRRLDVIDTLSTPDQIVTLWHFPGTGRYPPQPKFEPFAFYSCFRLGDP